jgi:hypothetical protein
METNRRKEKHKDKNDKNQINKNARTTEGSICNKEQGTKE